MTQRGEVGNTKTQGWEFGIRRTFPISSEQLWELITTQPGLGYWLGEGVEVAGFKKGQPYTTHDGTTGEIRSYTVGSLIRMTWQPPDWDFASTVQIRILPAKTGATFSIHHEKMQNGDQREAMRARWGAVMDQLQSLIDGKPIR